MACPVTKFYSAKSEGATDDGRAFAKSSELVNFLLMLECWECWDRDLRSGAARAVWLLKSCRKDADRNRGIGRSLPCVARSRIRCARSGCPRSTALRYSCAHAVLSPGLALKCAARS
eukprot:1593411-Rhodomonas_salina.3